MIFDDKMKDEDYVKTIECLFDTLTDEDIEEGKVLKLVINQDKVRVYKVNIDEGLWM